MGSSLASCVLAGGLRTGQHGRGGRIRMPLPHLTTHPRPLLKGREGAQTLRGCRNRDQLSKLATVILETVLHVSPVVTGSRSAGASYFQPSLQYPGLRPPPDGSEGPASTLYWRCPSWLEPDVTGLLSPRVLGSLMSGTVGNAKGPESSVLKASGLFDIGLKKKKKKKSNKKSILGFVLVFFFFPFPFVFF